MSCATARARIARFVSVDTASEAAGDGASIVDDNGNAGSTGDAENGAASAAATPLLANENTMAGSAHSLAKLSARRLPRAAGVSGERSTGAR